MPLLLCFETEHWMPTDHTQHIGVDAYSQAAFRAYNQDL